MSVENRKCVKCENYFHTCPGYKDNGDSCVYTCMLCNVVYQLSSDAAKCCS